MKRSKLPPLPTFEELEALELGQCKPVDLHPISGDWISTREARDILIQECRIFPREAERTICRRVLRWTPAKVETFSRHEKRHEYVDDFAYSSIPRDDLSHFSTAPTVRAWNEVRLMFEQLAEHEPFICENGVEYAHWATGDFKITIFKDFSDVTLEVAGLKLDRVAFLASVGVNVTAGPAKACDRIDGATLDKWIRGCPTENSKEAWRLLQNEFGKAAPKREEVFLPAWRRAKGERRRGRLRNPPK